MNKSKRNKPITKVKYSKIIINVLIGTWFLIPILFLRPIKKIYLAPLQTSRIGHFILDTEILLARIHIDQVNKRNNILVIWIPESFICNQYVYNIWKQKIRIIPANVITSAIMQSAIYLEKIIKMRIIYRFIGWDGYLPYVHLLEFTPKVFSIPIEDEELCNKILQAEGVDTGKQWVCLLARDNAYLNHVQPNLTWDFNSYRNSDIDSFMEAAEYLAGNDILVFRMGAHVDKPFESKNTKYIIDYANASWRTEMLDIFLSIKCLFYISTATGLDAVSYATRNPILTVNLAQPLTGIYSKKNHLFIMKKFFSKESENFLTVAQYYELGVKGGFTVDNPRHFRTQDFARLGIEVIDNTASEIKDATKDMYEFIVLKKSQSDDLSPEQVSFWEKFPKVPGTDNSSTYLSMICNKFIQENLWLLK